MNTILTDDEIDAIWREHLHRDSRARAVEAAALAKLAQQPVGLKPGQYVIMHNDDGEFGQKTGWLYREGGQPCIVTGKPVYVWRPLRDLIGEPSHPAPQQADRQRVPEVPARCHKRANDYCKCSRKAMLCDGVGPAAEPEAPAQDEPMTEREVDEAATHAAANPAQADLKRVRGGWKLVPVEPPEEMARAGAQYAECGLPANAVFGYRAMLAAAPEAPAQEPHCFDGECSDCTPRQDFSDAYQGAREDLAIWKKRALEAEELNRKFMREINGQTFMGEPASKTPSQASAVDARDRKDAERYLRRLLAVRVAMPHTYFDDGEAQGSECGISIDFMREPVADIDAKLRALNVARAALAQKGGK